MILADWTYDLFIEDSTKYKATPIKGVHCRKNASNREQFMVWFKNYARDFKDEWLKANKHLYNEQSREYIGDAFAKEFGNILFSDFYKDAYGQRPHLADWFYIQAVNFPTNEDVSRKFCAMPVEDAIERAKYYREFYN